MPLPSAAVAYAVEPDLHAREFTDVLRCSGLEAHRPVTDADRIGRMLAHADLIVTARDGAGRLIGVARSLTDFALCCYVSDLAVDRAWQRRGIGRELLRRTHAKAGGAEQITLLLRSTPDAVAYYPRTGLECFDICFGRRRKG